jgi:putative NIF3 family GTP cyclohydrolase 1 type 2
MNANKLYQKLEIDFELDKCKDDWSQMDFNEFVTDNFRQRQMGLVLDNTSEIKKVYTAVFPSDAVSNTILEKGEKNILLFTHHPMIWDTKAPGFPFLNMNKELLTKLKEREISMYTLHVPLDKNGEYSTSVSFARAIGISYDEDFAEYFGIWAGVLGKTTCKTFDELADKVRKTVGHEVKVIRNNPEIILGDQKIAVVGGGGNDLDVMRELSEKGIKIYVSGLVSSFSDYPPALEFDRLAKENKINLIGASHYSSEKFACMQMVKYFETQGLAAEFIEDKPDIGDVS